MIFRSFSLKSIDSLGAWLVPHMGKARPRSRRGHLIKVEVKNMLLCETFKNLEVLWALNSPSSLCPLPLSPAFPYHVYIWRLIVFLFILQYLVYLQILNKLLIIIILFVFMFLYILLWTGRQVADRNVNTSQPETQKKKAITTEMLVSLNRFILLAKGNGLWLNVNASPYISHIVNSTMEAQTGAKQKNKTRGGSG